MLTSGIGRAVRKLRTFTRLGEFVRERSSGVLGTSRPVAQVGGIGKVSRAAFGRMVQALEAKRLLNSSYLAQSSKCEMDDGSVFTPKALNSLAQGRASRTLGQQRNRSSFYPEGIAHGQPQTQSSQSSSRIRGYFRLFNPFGVGNRGRDGILPGCAKLYVEETWVTPWQGHR